LPSTDALLILYYAGLGFVVVLGWAAIAGDLNEPFDDQRRARWNRASAVVAAVGLIHPALPFVSRDIAAQTNRTDDDTHPARSWHQTFATACAAISIAIAAAVIAVTT